jgi:hypothetical protein
MADYLDTPGNSIAPEQSAQTQDQQLPGYRYGKALCETARAGSSDRIKSFKENWRFLLGQDQWGTPQTSAAKQIDQWAFKGIVNWTYATVKTKAAMLCSAPTELFCDPLDQASTYYDRLLVKSALEHEMTRLRFRQVKEDAYLWGSASGVGVAMVTAKADQLTGAMKLALLNIRSDEFYRDPSADSITSPNCRFVVWETELDMSQIREMWPSKANEVKTSARQVTGGWTYHPDNTDNNLIYGTAGEFVVDSANTLKSRKALVSFIWIRDESLIEDLQSVMVKDAGPGLSCTSCGTVYEEDATPGLNLGEPCPTCDGALEQITIPPKIEQNRIVRRQYPYGRLIVYSGTTLLYDGENPYEIEGVFPFFVYHHDRIPGDFYGANDVTLLKSLQIAENTVVSMGVDGVVLSMFGPFEYPIGAKSYTALGNGPKERHPVPDHLTGKAHFIPPASADMNLWSGVLNALQYHFTVVSGLNSVSFGGQSGSPPVSATEAEISNARLSDRMKGHAAGLSQFMSDGSNIIWQMMQQFYGDAQEIPVTMPNSEVTSINIEVKQLPKVRVRVEVNTQPAFRDKLLGQNAVPLLTNPAVVASPYFPDALEAIGFPPARIKEMMVRRGTQQETAPTGAPVGPSEAAPPNLSLVPPQADGGPIG